MSASAQKSALDGQVPNPQLGIQGFPQKAPTLYSNIFPYISFTLHPNAWTFFGSADHNLGLPNLQFCPCCNSIPPSALCNLQKASSRPNPSLRSYQSTAFLSSSECTFLTFGHIHLANSSILPHDFPSTVLLHFHSGIIY